MNHYKLHACPPLRRQPSRAETHSNETKPRKTEAHTQAQEDGPAIRLEWLDNDSRGYHDLLPLSWFAKVSDRLDCVHWTIGPRGGVYAAWCNISVGTKTALLDYEAFDDINEDNGIFSGHAKLVFSDARRTQLAQVLWKRPEGKFRPARHRHDLIPSLRELLSAKDDLPAGETTPRTKTATHTFYVRNQEVRDSVVQRARGKCEYCNAPTFRKIDGDHYIETHHILALSSGGEDTMSNVIALCPNHHREAHYGINRKKLNLEMLDKIKAASSKT